MSQLTGPAATPPLNWPHYGIGPIAAVTRGFRKYATFSGRASRSEFWWWIAFAVVGYLGPALLGAIVNTLTETPTASGSYPVGVPAGILLGLGFLILLSTIVPSIAVSVRRLHDAGFSGWFYLLNFIPTIGSLIGLVLCSLPTSPQAARWGPPLSSGPPYPTQYPPG